MIMCSLNFFEQCIYIFIYRYINCKYSKDANIDLRY